MRLLAAGGGSGGHVTPVLAVINELSKHDSGLAVCFVTDKKFGRVAAEIMRGAKVPVETNQVLAGKFRRYHKVSATKQLLDIPTVLKNIRDLFYIGIGTVQSLWLVYRYKPDVVFTKGGFVCVPVGLAAKLFGVPLVIHDSDAHPGLANRILARFATLITTGSPLENYNYPAIRSRYVGIPVDSKFSPKDDDEQRDLKERLGFPDLQKPVVAVTGGGLGARNINNAMISIAPRLLEKTAVYHVTGETTYADVHKRAPQRADYIVVPYVSTGMANIFGAADVVVTRAGATAIQELAAMEKATIIIPNPMLTGGHQLKNAAVYADAGAAIVLDEDELKKRPAILLDALSKLLEDSAARKKLGHALKKFARPDAAIDMASAITQVAHNAKKHKKINPADTN
jgi:UDP-N-acetylglucosamine--N-acetylmuramyl-(pentapeptide) pyrophosphoryl-undecaprenol N-acetylglucosamine transferase